ncbi:hypothetical protein EAG_04862 [Camponotus floridanus]|uniref:Uncharacterized protein n=1 Tax=Camponotus floridanus TaxID=104421 RepID=E2ASJ1_CAMFO|nr:hypothetical protein EAG_04862 [Camponotus floridanus]
MSRMKEKLERRKKPCASAAAMENRRIAMPRSPTLSLAASTAAQSLHANQPTDPLSSTATHPPPSHPSHVYPSIPRLVSSASITNPSTTKEPLVTGNNILERVFYPITYLHLIIRDTNWPNFHVQRAATYTIFSCMTSVRSRVHAHQIRIIIPDVRIYPKRNRAVKAAEILSVRYRRKDSATGYPGNNRPTSPAADECDNRDSRPAGRRRCQRRDDAATAPRTIAAAEDARTRVPGDTPDNGPGDGTPDDGTPDDVPAPGRTDAGRAPAGVAARTAAGSGPASGRFCTACSIAGSTCDNSIPATWSQAGPGSRGGS